MLRKVSPALEDTVVHGSSKTIIAVILLIATASAKHPATQNARVGVRAEQASSGHNDKPVTFLLASPSRGESEGLVTCFKVHRYDVTNSGHEPKSALLRRTELSRRSVKFIGKPSSAGSDDPAGVFNSSGAVFGNAAPKVCSFTCYQPFPAPRKTAALYWEPHLDEGARAFCNRPLNPGDPVKFNGIQTVANATTPQVSRA